MTTINLGIMARYAFDIPGMCKMVGYYATMRWLCNQTGCNEQTAMRCIQASKLCTAAQSI